MMKIEFGEKIVIKFYRSKKPKQPIDTKIVKRCEVRNEEKNEAVLVRVAVFFTGSENKIKILC